MIKMKTPLHWEKDDDWHYGICSNCAHNSHEKIKMVKKKIKENGSSVKRGSFDCAGEIEVWICPICGYCREL